MQLYSLNGDWELRQAGTDDCYPAKIPGCVHLDLLAADAIEDPFYRDNELSVQWISETDWLYSRTFSLDDTILMHNRLLLRCEGLDTLATITINGQQVATTDNMFRTWEFDVKQYVHSGENIIEIAFQAPLPYVRNKEVTVAPLYAWGVGQHKSNGGGWLRKQPSNFGWDWGPMLTTCGIWRTISLLAINNARLQDVHILQDHQADGGVSLDIQASVEQFSSADMSLHFEVRYEEQTVIQERVPYQAGQHIHLNIPNPHLWWPHGMGNQPLYEVVVQLFDQDGTMIDIQRKRIGLRTLRLVCQTDEWGESFEFSANGIPFFAKGANWIPADTFVTRLTEADYRRLIEAARDVHMNMLRVWGGGIYEPDIFYDVCDELGICVWQDFMFACSTYPTYDADFMNSVKAEAQDTIRRIRHHASLALWCGNNELEQGLVANEWTATTMSWADYELLFDDLLKQLVNELAPQTDYWPGSPHSPHVNRADFGNPDYGDAHNWQVWHGRQPFEFYRTSQHRFVSEFGFQSFPEPQTVEAYTLPQDRNITSFIMEHHQRSLIGNSTIVHYMTDWFRLPTSFDMMLWLSQILQGLAIKYAVEHWRRNMPRTMGALFWQINDCWPVASWSSIDFFGRWKALHYMARRFFAPLLISGVEDIERGTVNVYVSSDAGNDQPAQIIWKLTRLDGTIVSEGNTDLTVMGRKSVCVQTLDFKREIEIEGKRNLLLWLSLCLADKVVSSNLVTFARPKHLELPNPGLKADVRRDEQNFKVTVTAERPSLYTWLTLSELDANFSDNFVHLLPGQALEITISGLPENISLATVQDRLMILSLTDTYFSH